jgi:hypothetical protein
MKKLIAMLLAAVFAGVSFNAIAQDKKPTAKECEANPKLKGCEDMKSAPKK